MYNTVSAFAAKLSQVSATGSITQIYKIMKNKPEVSPWMNPN
jgi:hypothetical protein